MASDLARLFVIAHDYDVDSALYQSRADSYDVKGALYVEFIGALMSSDEYQQQLNKIASSLELSVDDLLQSGFNFLEKIIFSENRNHYQILGLEKDASDRHIRKQYRFLIALFHPDKCDACQIDGHHYSSRLNQAYNTLKKSESRKEYDEALIYKSNLSRKSNKQVKTSGVNKASKNNSAKRTLFSLGRMFFNLPVINKHPKLTVWTLLVTGLSFMIYFSSSDVIEVEKVVKVAAKLNTESRENKPVAVTMRVKPSVIKNSGEAYLEQSIQSENLSHMLDNVPGSDIQTTVIKSVDKQNVAPEIAETQSISDSVDIAPLSGFDGGPPGSIKNISKLLNEDARNTYSLDAYSMPPELVLMQFVQGYETGDIEGMSKLFTRDVRTSQGGGRQQLISQYSALFDSTSKRKIQIKELKVEPLSQKEALLITDIEATLHPDNTSTTRNFNGEIVFRLVADDLGMQIAEIAHSVR